MTPDQAMDKLRERANQVRDAGRAEDLLGPAQQVARQIATQVRMEATRRGHTIGVRVMSKAGGIRVTVTGPYAGRYRDALSKAFDQQLPRVTTEIRSMITRRAK